MSADGASFFCTVGSGMEPFCSDELALLGCNITQVIQGKVFFRSELEPANLLKIRTAERLFVTLENKPRVAAPYPAACLATLFSESVATSAESYSKWTEFQVTGNEAKRPKV